MRATVERATLFGDGDENHWPWSVRSRDIRPISSNSLRATGSKLHVRTIATVGGCETVTNTSTRRARGQSDK